MPNTPMTEPSLTIAEGENSPEQGSLNEEEIEPTAAIEASLERGCTTKEEPDQIMPPKYHQALSESLERWRELDWLKRFLTTAIRADEIVQNTHATFLELRGQRLVPFAQAENVRILNRILEAPETNSNLRIIIFTHGESWDVDREMLDVVCQKYKIDPRFLVNHLGHAGVHLERNCPKDITLDVGGLQRGNNGAIYNWKLGGELANNASFQTGSAFFFSYENSALSLAIDRDSARTTVFAFHRAPSSELSKDVLPFLQYGDGRVLNSSFLDTPRHVHVTHRIIEDMCSTKPSKADTDDIIIAKTFGSALQTLVQCAYARYQRRVAPRQLENPRNLENETETLHTEIEQLVHLRRQAARFYRVFAGEKRLSGTGLFWAQEIDQPLTELIQDAKDLLSFFAAGERHTESLQQRGLIKAQVEEVTEAKKTSIGLRRISRLTYAFLPLQVTVSGLGMNLKAFASGVGWNYFGYSLFILSIVSFLPLLIPMLFEGLSERLQQIRAIRTHSSKVALIYASFCLFHSHSTNEDLWTLGLSWDIRAFDGLDPARPPKIDFLIKRRTRFDQALLEGMWAFYGLYWQRKLEEMFSIIDQPQWGKLGAKQHGA